MIVQGEHVQHQICDGCPGGVLLTEAVEASNNSLHESQQAAIARVNQNYDDSVAIQPERQVYREPLRNLVIAGILAGGTLRRAVCLQNASSLIRGCGVEVEPTP